jgi:hypothetical protein
MESAAYLGVDVGKISHYALAVDGAGSRSTRLAWPMTSGH